MTYIATQKSAYRTWKVSLDYFVICVDCIRCVQGTWGYRRVTAAFGNDTLQADGGGDICR